MARFENNGKPTKQTKADVNDIYVDLETGLSYRCTMIVKAGFDTEYWWEQDPLEYKFSNTQSYDEFMAEMSTQPQPKRHNYNKQGRKNKR